MKSFNIIYVVLISLLLPACDKQESKEEKEFVQVCKSESNTLDRKCRCIFNKLKNKYSQEQLLELYSAKDEESSSGKHLRSMMILHGVCE